MTWKGVPISIKVASRGIERDDKRGQRELEQQARAHEKMEQLVLSGSIYDVCNGGMSQVVQSAPLRANT